MSTRGSDESMEQHLRAVTVGEPQVIEGTIHLAEYDPSWPEHFRVEAERITRALGAAALSVEHVGSTSVPGLAAKPRIDVLLVVADSGDEPAYLPQLESAGYVLRIREPEWYEHRVFKGPAFDTNLHVFSPGCPEIERMITFRDRLRSHPPDRERYERTKRALAAKTWRYVQQYADAKGEVIEAILASSRASR